jgi:hypothetical protein
MTVLSRKWLASITGAVLLIPILSCSEDSDGGGEGTLQVELWGEAFIEEGIPAEEPPDVDGFVDGFSVAFDHFVISLGQISVGEEGSPPAVEAASQRIWDLTESGPFEITTADVPSGEYDHAAYAISPAGKDAESGNAGAEVVEMMIADELSVFIAGTATDGDVTKTFEWGFDTDTVYDPCHSNAVVEDGGDASVQITIHGDHLFYDSAVSESPSLRFSDVADADTTEGDGDDVITEEELLDYDITGLPNYGVGNLDIDNLWDYIAHMTTTLGHIDGEGHCE